MSSLKLSERQKKLCVKNKLQKKQITKTTLTNPYDFNWPDVPRHHEEIICKKIKDLFTLLKLAKPKMTDFSDMPKKLTVQEKNAHKKEKLKGVWGLIKVHRCHLKLGLSEVISCLERKELCALLVCRDVSPYFMIQPVLTLCSSQSICAAAIRNLGDTLSTLLNFKSCRAIGFKNSVANNKTNIFHELYLLIKQTVPQLPLMFEPVKNETDSPCPNEEIKQERAANVPKVEPVQPAQKDYSSFYITKREVEPIQATDASEFIAIEQIPVVVAGKRKRDDQPGMEHHMQRDYRGMKFKQLKAMARTKK